MEVHNDDIYHMFCTQHNMRPLRYRYMQNKLRKLYERSLYLSINILIKQRWCHQWHPDKEL